MRQWNRNPLEKALALFVTIGGALILISLAPSFCMLSSVVGTSVLYRTPIAEPDYSADVPDGVILVQAAFDNGEFDLYAIDLETQEMDRLTDHRGVEGQGDWSPDGQHIVFTGSREEDAGLYIMDASGLNRRLLLSESTMPELDEPVWSPQGDRILFVGRGDDDFKHIYMMNADGSDVQQVTADAIHDVSPDWSPDGQRLTFVRYMGLEQDSEIFIVDASGENLTQLTENATDDYWPAWSPDGTRIAFSNDVTGDSRSGYQLFMIYPRDGYVQQITDLADQKIGLNEPAWTPDGRYILALVSGEGIASGLYLVRPEGGQLIALFPTDGWLFNPQWKPQFIALP